jgi:hypothetical protein
LLATEDITFQLADSDSARLRRFRLTEFNLTMYLHALSSVAGKQPLGIARPDVGEPVYDD